MKKKKKIFKRFLIVCFLFTLTIFSGAWTKTNNDDFSAGTLSEQASNSMSNLYGFSFFVLYENYPSLFVSNPNGTNGYEIIIDLSSTLRLDADASISRSLLFNMTIPRLSTELPLNCVSANATWGSNDGIASYQGKVHLFVDSCDTVDLSSYIINLKNIYADIQFWYIGQGYLNVDVGYTQYQTGYDKGLSDGLRQGYQEGVYDTQIEAYDNGYRDGASDSGEFNLVTLFTAVVSWPYNFFREVLNFDLLGINLWAILTSLLTLGVVVFVIKKLWR